MPRYVAFLRGINIGNRRVTMDRLREVFESFGLRDVSTFIASGNVIFDATEPPAALEAGLERRLAASLGFPVDTFLRTVEELESVLRFAASVTPAEDGWTPHVAFVREPVGDDVADRLRRLETDGDRFPVHGREIYWLRRGRMSDSAVSAGALEKAIGVPHTMRNVSTVERIVEKYGRVQR